MDLDGLGKGLRCGSVRWVGEGTRELRTSFKSITLPAPPEHAQNPPNF